ncbi:MAG: hypothetical protein WCP52_01145 [Bacteroidota bacterium]
MKNGTNQPAILVLIIGLVIGFATVSKAQIKVSSSNPTAEELGEGKWLVNNDKKLNAEMIKTDSKQEIRVSFAGNEGPKGNLKIYNSIHQLITEYTIELKKAPEYYSIYVAEFSDGEFTLRLTTDKGMHTTQLTIN